MVKDSYSNFGFRFDRRDALRLSLQALQDVLDMRMIRELSEEDMDWYKAEVEKIFAPFLPERHR